MVVPRARAATAANDWQSKQRRQTARSEGGQGVSAATKNNVVRLRPGDALLIVDVQNDFLPEGALPVPDGDRVIGPLNRYIERFTEVGLPVFATRDWHPPDHCSFQAQGGPWPPHCIAGTTGAQFPSDLKLPSTATIVSKGTRPDEEAYSGFKGTSLENLLRKAGVDRLFVGGLATDYCVRNTVLDALERGFDVFLLVDAVRAVDVHPGDGQRAVREMLERGARPLDLHQLDASPRGDDASPLRK